MEIWYLDFSIATIGTQESEIMIDSELPAISLRHLLSDFYHLLEGEKGTRMSWHILCLAT
jgi:hypothetical protein